MDETGWASLDLKNTTKVVVGGTATEPLPGPSTTKAMAEDSITSHISLSFAVCADGSWSTPMFIFEGKRCCSCSLI